jgi:tetratricopeptide (TPR) repeat protein
VEGAARSHPYVGMGVSLYHMEEYEYALRCFERARAVYGLNLEVESVENAILQNNIGCCLMMLSRNQEALKYFEVGHHILDLKVGCFDERTLVVQQNFNKNRKAYL